MVREHPRQLVEQPGAVVRGDVHDGVEVRHIVAELQLRRARPRWYAPPRDAASASDELLHCHFPPEHLPDHLLQLLPLEALLLLPSRRRGDPEDLQGEPVAGGVDVGAKNVDPHRGEGSRDVRVEPRDVSRTQNELAEIPTHGADRGGLTSFGRKRQNHPRMPRDLTGRVREEVALGHGIEEVLDPRIRDTQTA